MVGKRAALGSPRASSRWRSGWKTEKTADALSTLTARDRYVFDLQGYLLFEQALDEATVARLRAAIDRQGLPAADDTIERQRFGNDGRMFTWDRAFADLIDHPLARAVALALIGPYVRLDHAYGITMRPGTSGLGLHGPAEPFDASQYYLHRMGAMRSGLLTLSWALSGGGPGDGGFGCIPGSHRASEPLPPGAESLVVEVPQPAGSLLVFTEALMHCTVPWRASGTRWALLYKYSPGSTAWGPGPAAPAEVVATMTDRQQRFFQPPSVGGRIPALSPSRAHLLLSVSVTETRRLGRRPDPIFAPFQRARPYRGSTGVATPADLSVPIASANLRPPPRPEIAIHSKCPAS